MKQAGLSGKDKRSALKRGTQRAAALFLAVLTVLTLPAFLSGCGAKAPLKITEDRTVYALRTPLRSSGDTMKVLISDPPGEDPYVVTSGAAPDPFVCFDNTTDYYYGLSTQNSVLVLHRAKLLEDLFLGEEYETVYVASAEAEVVGSIWTPEMYFLDGRWYIYTSGQLTYEDGTKHMFVLESETADPFDGFHFKAFLDNSVFGIDPTVYADRNSDRRYICFSQVVNGGQALCLAELTTPWEMRNLTLISDPARYEWERTSDGPLNEGPFFVTSGERLFIIYSANGCYSDTYCLGVLEYKGGNPLKIDNWEKHPEPVFRLNKSENVFAPGHASFFYSPDHTELWIAYHCYYSHNYGAKRRMRVCHVQKVEFDENGYPAFGTPLGGETLIPVPSGE